jgi:hypothetical protein
MSMGNLLVLPFTLGSITTSGANSATLIVPMPVQILQVGGIVTTAVTVTNAVLTWNVTAAGGGALTPTGAAALGTTTFTVGGSGAVGKGIYKDVSIVNGRRILYPGEVLTAAVTTTSTAGAVTAFALCALLGFNNVDMRSSVTNHAGATTNPTALSALTRVIA